MRSDEMIVGAPPLEAVVEFAGQLGGAPGAASERGEGATHGQIEAFNEGGLNATGEAEGLELGGEGVERAAEHLAIDADQTSATMDLLDLGIEQVG